MKFKVTWETDGKDIDLPEIVDVPDDVLVGDIADWLSRNYGWLVSELKVIA